MAEVKPPVKRGSVSRATYVLLGITVAGMIAFVALLGVTVYLVNKAERGEVTEGTWLRVHLAGGIGDGPPAADLFAEPGQTPPIPTEVARAIRKAGTDERISGLYLDLDAPRMGWGVTREVRDAIVAFRESGKPCVTYSQGYMTQDYYLASACDRVVVAPSGVAMVSGMEVSVTYYKGTFDWLGIQPDFEHVGDFKTATEPYTLTGPSEPAIKSYDYLLDGIWSVVIADMAKSRARTPEEIQAVVDALPLSPEAALTSGLVDAIAYPDAVVANLADVKSADWATKLAALPVDDPDKTDEEVFEAQFTKISEYVKEIRADDAGQDNQIAVVYAEGPIVSGSGGGGLFSDAALADGAFSDWMQTIREDDDIKAVVLRVNSPGGSGLASDNMWHDIERVQAAGKPVVVSMANYAASGGYYIACSTDWVVAEPTTITGSIGVLGGKLALSGAYTKVGLSEYTWKRGANADIFSETQPFSEAGRTAFKGYLESFYKDFVGRVSEGRKKSFDDVHAVAQGRVWTGDQAKERGLVDEIGGLDVALKKAAELAKLDAYGVRKLPEQKDFFTTLLEGMEQAKQPEIALPPGFDAQADAVMDVMRLKVMLGDDGVLAVLPGDLEVR